MAAHKTNPFLKWAVIFVAILMLIMMVAGLARCSKPSPPMGAEKATKESASKDSAKESLDTLTAELGETQQTVKAVVKTNEELKAQNESLLAQVQGKKDQKTTELNQEVEHLKTQLQTITNHPVSPGSHQVNASEAVLITTVPELAVTLDPKGAANNHKASSETSILSDSAKPKAVPYYTIPANATAVKDRLMTALVGRIPVKGVVTDPYPFKLVFSDNTLAASGFRVPHLKQMIVSGYTEGDLNLVSVRGWVTSLTFVFNDGTISTTSSNENNIGKYTKDSALGYLSDKFGNPFTRGKLITNAPSYLGMNVLLGAAQGAANAYGQSQATSQSNLIGTATSSVTGSPGAYVTGQAASNAAAQVEQWWHDREAQSFDAVYVPTVDEKTQEPIFIAVNFAKEIQIDYDPQGRKVVYGRAHAFLISEAMIFFSCAYCPNNKLLFHHYC
jgi:integrating conjugative element protein (TIGR03752 family)